MGQMSPQELADCRQWFASVDADRSGNISVAELQVKENETKRKGK